MGNSTVNLLFLGDIFLGEKPSIRLSSEIQSFFSFSDLLIANQEGPITRSEKSINGKCCLKSAPEAAQILRSWGIGIVSLANNHMFDYGWEGFEQTQERLDNAGIGYLGAGKNLNEATQPLILELKGIKIGLLAYSWGFVQTTCASDNTFGCAPIDRNSMTLQVRELSQEVDAVIVLPHWGYCEYLFPAPEQVELGKHLIEAGATAVVGHHSHVVQGVVKENNTLVAYSLGNFAFAKYSYGYQNVKLTRENLQGAILKLVLKPGKVVSYQIIHTIQLDDTIRTDDSERRRAEFAERRSILVYADYAKYWRRYLRRRLFKRILYWINVLHWRNIHKETITGAFLMLGGLFRSKTKKQKP